MNLEIPQELQDRLLKIGGTEFSDSPNLIAWRKTPGYAVQTSHLLAHGQEFDGRMNFLIGPQGGCHLCAAALYFYSNRRAAMWTGWGLDALGVWREHSWNIFESEIYETNGKWVKYFGFAHPDPEAWATRELKKVGELRDNPDEYKNLFGNDEESLRLLAKLRNV